MQPMQMKIIRLRQHVTILVVLSYLNNVIGILARTPGFGPRVVDKKSYAEELQEQMKVNDEKKRQEKAVSFLLNR
jgi:hypothetical protein